MPIPSGIPLSLGPPVYVPTNSCEFRAIAEMVLSPELDTYTQLVLTSGAEATRGVPKNRRNCRIRRCKSVPAASAWDWCRFRLPHRLRPDSGKESLVLIDDHVGGRRGGLSLRLCLRVGSATQDARAQEDSGEITTQVGFQSDSFLVLWKARGHNGKQNGNAADDRRSR